MTTLAYGVAAWAALILAALAWLLWGLRNHPACPLCGQRCSDDADVRWHLALEHTRAEVDAVLDAMNERGGKP